MDKSDVDNGFDYPIWMSRPNGNLNGIVYLGKQFGDLEGCVLALDQAGNEIMMIRPSSNSNEKVEARVFLNITSPVDAVATSTGEIYVLTRDYNRLYRVRPN